jgi:NAD(P)H-hydrate epimerase
MEGVLLSATKSDELEQTRALANTADVIVDALLGTGSTGAPRGTIADLIRIANDAPRARRVAVDIPSGLNADTGEVGEPCFKADATVTFVAPKVGFGRPAASEVLGRVIVADIGVPRELIPGRKEIPPGA